MNNSKNKNSDLTLINTDHNGLTKSSQVRLQPLTLAVISYYIGIRQRKGISAVGSQKHAQCFGPLEVPLKCEIQ